MSNDIWNARREQLQAALVKAALELAGHTGAYSYAVPVPGTLPLLLVTLSAQAQDSKPNAEGGA